ncbi:alpha/beta hydrolase [Caulobacter segnis]|uniref:Alpha/beta hydrolase fold protein n=2 Tax=Caulobacter segnis TaxID=88688 RepID=D5VE29_CAUST|nr:alpha/beta hydrolase [Caulobacter segnis]ADG08729.1 alpha/beta hydrolase fold protein [Caulobacter segnis ATCC 21756]AVQ00579.1 alpha/beta hydrolase [Caulobacter segnis]
MTRSFRNILIAAAAIAGLASAAQAQTAPSGARNVVLVHGAFADGSGWRGVYDRLTAKGYKVSVVQNPLTSLADDVAATRRVLARQDGPTILVGHSYGGTVITEAGNDPKVAGLVYVAALAPDTGESTGDQFAEIPAPPGFVIEAQSDGFGFVNLAKFKSGFAGDVSDADAAFMRDSQVPIAMSAFGDKVTQAAWRVKPSWFVVATQDGAIDPKLLRKTATRIGAETVEIKGSHVVFLSQPEAVANVIDKAAKTAGQKTN